jgi:UDP-2-acetamido-2-deoxy-ribo-hexuluronate aminotransferase
MQFCDLKAQYNAYQQEIDEAIQGVLETSAFIKGPALKRFQEAMKSYVGVGTPWVVPTGPTPFRLP